MTINNIFYWALIGGFGGFISEVFCFTLSFFFLDKSSLHFLSLFISSISFTVVGITIVLSLYLSTFKSKNIRLRLILSGLIGGAILGIFVHIGTFGVYIGFFLFCLSVSISIIGSKLKAFIYSYIGSIVGIILGTIFVILFPIVAESRYISLLLIPVITYFLNFGLLFSLKNLTLIGMEVR